MTATVETLRFADASAGWSYAGEIYHDKGEAVFRARLSPELKGRPVLGSPVWFSWEPTGPDCARILRRRLKAAAKRRNLSPIK